MAHKSLLRHWGLDKEWTKLNIIEFLREQKVVPYWNELYGELLFRPAVFGTETRKKVQHILRIKNKKEADSLRAELGEKSSE
jgi:hypothetical protein